MLFNIRNTNTSDFLVQHYFWNGIFQTAHGKSQTMALHFTKEEAERIIAEELPTKNYELVAVEK